MSRRKFYTLTGVVVAGMLAIPLFVLSGHAQNADPAEAPAEMPPELPPLPEELDDPAFEQYVNITLLEAAWGDLDAELLTDVALQLAAGEKVLMRSHKAGSAEDLLKLATGVAAKNGDKDAVARIAKAADALGFDGLKAQVATAEKVAGASRKSEPALNVPADQATTVDFVNFKDILHDVKSAEVLGNREMLEDMDTALDDVEGLTDERRNYLKLVIGEALDSVPEEDDAQQNSIGATIKKLEGESRAHGRNRALVGNILLGVGTALGHSGRYGHGGGWRYGHGGGWRYGHGGGWRYGHGGGWRYGHGGGWRYGHGGGWRYGHGGGWRYGHGGGWRYGHGHRGWRW